MAKLAKNALSDSLQTVREELQRLIMYLRTIRIDSFSYYIAYTLYAISCFLEHTMFESVFGLSKGVLSNGIHLVVLFLLAVKYILQRMPLKGWVITVIIVSVSFISWRQSGEGWLFWLALFMVCAEDADIKILAGIIACVVAVLFPITVIFANAGVIENYISVRAGITRQALGFAHPNAFGFYLLLFCTAFSVLRFGQEPLPNILLIVAIVPVNLVVADSRASAALSILQIILLLIFYAVKTPRMRKALSTLFIIGTMLIISVSYWLMVNYDASNALEAMLDSALSGRIVLAHKYYLMQPLTLFGSSFSQFAPIYMDNGVPSSFTVDNAYCHLLLRYGIVPTLLFLCGLIALLVKLNREGRWDYLLFGLVLMCFYGLGESLGIRVECNFFLIAMVPELLHANVDSHSGAGQATRNYIRAANSLTERTIR